MKNLFVLPTDKPSRLFVYDGKLGLAKESQYGSVAIQNHKIYITNEEKTKYGDWCIDLDSYFVFEFATPYKHKRVKKIILTTDQDLIKDGVQAIDDEFLEWFVKNPSCEEVDVKNPLIANVSDFGYKIIIPKEDFCDNCNNDVCCCIIRVQPKQETLEEKLDKIVSKEPSKFLEESDKRTKTNEELYNACTEYSNNHYSTEKGHPEEDWYISWLAFNNGAKWQQEQDKNKYSEEEVREMCSEEELLETIQKITDLKLNEFQNLLQLLEFKPTLKLLTEELLLDLGFQKLENNWKCLDLVFATIGWERLAGLTLSFEKESIFLPHIKYVHQLQNLYFSLTGEKLTIKNK